jgi:pimeloyl-ACP methyl ester carboxylesterase
MQKITRNYLRWFVGLAYLFTLCAATSCSHVTHLQKGNEEMATSSTIKICSTAVIPRAKVVWIHGLNNSPQTLVPLAEQLAAEGVESHIVALSGHRPDSKPKKSDFDQWMKEIAHAHSSARNGNLRIPVITAGYSMGGALAVAFSRRDQRGKATRGHPGLDSDGLMLLAPAIQLPAWYSLSYPFQMFEFLGLPFPSFVPASARAHRFTSLTTYKQLGKARAEVLDVEGMNSELVAPMALIYHPEDSLVPSEKLSSWLDKSWKGSYETYQVACEQCYARHLFLRPEDMEAKEWNGFVDSVKSAIEFVLAEVMAALPKEGEWVR